MLQNPVSAWKISYEIGERERLPSIRHEDGDEDNEDLLQDLFESEHAYELSVGTKTDCTSHSP